MGGIYGLRNDTFWRFLSFSFTFGVNGCTGGSIVGNVFAQNLLIPLPAMLLPMRLRLFCFIFSFRTAAAHVTGSRWVVLGLTCALSVFPSSGLYYYSHCTFMGFSGGADIPCCARRGQLTTPPSLKALCITSQPVEGNQFRYLIKSRTLNINISS